MSSAPMVCLGNFEEHQWDAWIRTAANEWDEADENEGYRYGRECQRLGCSARERAEDVVPTGKTHVTHNEAIDCHNKAMTLVDQAVECRRSGNEDAAKGFFRRAFDAERRAAFMTLKEPSRSVLYRSAATLALDLGDFKQATRLATEGLILATGPIVTELQEVLERARNKVSP